MINKEQWEELCKALNGKTVLWTHHWSKGSHTFKVLILADKDKGISIKPLADVKRVAKIRSQCSKDSFKWCLEKVSDKHYCFYSANYHNLTLNEFEFFTKVITSSKIDSQPLKSQAGFGGPSCSFV